MWWRRRKGEPEDSVNTSPLDVEASDLLEEARRAAESRERTLANLPLVVSAGTFAFVVLKVLLISRGDPSTALGLVRSVGPVEVVSGALVLGLSFIGASVANMAAYLARSSELTAAERTRLWTLYAITAFVLSWVVSWFLTSVFAAYGIYYAVEAAKSRKRRTSHSKEKSPSQWLESAPRDTVLRALWHEYRTLQQGVLSIEGGPLDLTEVQRRRSRQGDIIRAYNRRVDDIRKGQRRPFDAIALGLALTTLTPLVTAALTDDPWLPAEEVALAGIDEPIVAYLAAIDGDWSMLLVEADRRLMYVKTRDVHERTVCRLKGRGDSPATLYELLGLRQAEPQYEACRDAPLGGQA